MSARLLLGRRKHLASVGADLQGRKSSSTSDNESSEARYTRTKMDGLHAATTRIRGALESGLSHLEQPSYVLLDDFYHIAFTDQPDVLAYLHQMVKNIDAYLKIGGVRHRLNPFVEGDPPRGLQVGQDAASISLDVTLDNFKSTKGFLEDVLAQICNPLGIEVADLTTDEGRTRLVLASGGVARDYLSLLHRAMRRANERSAGPYRPHNRVTAEDVNDASAGLSAEKQQDLRLDAGPDAEAVRNRLSRIVEFCLDFHSKNVFLVEGTKLEEETWGKEIQGLADLRLVHEIGNVSIKNPAHRGKRFVAFTLDLSNYTGTRSEQIEQVGFWEAGGMERLRVPGLIYEPDYADRAQRGERQPAREARVSATFDQPLPGMDANS